MKLLRRSKQKFSTLSKHEVDVNSSNSSYSYKKHSRPKTCVSCFIKQKAKEIMNKLKKKADEWQ